MKYTADESFLVLHTFSCGSRNRLNPHQCPEIGRGLSDRPIIAIVTLLAMGLHTGVLGVIALHLEICTCIHKVCKNYYRENAIKLLT